jgi:hypothetical protein
VRGSSAAAARDQAIRFDLDGNAVEVLPRAYAPGQLQVLIRGGQFRGMHSMLFSSFDGATAIIAMEDVNARLRERVYPCRSISSL